MRLQFFYIAMLFSIVANTQVIDVTPEGTWKTFYTYGSPITKSEIIIATDTQEINQHYLLFEDIGIIPDQKLYLYELDSINLYDFVYPIAERQIEEVITYFFASDTSGLSHILKFVPYIGQAEELELDGQWSAHIPFATLNQTSFIGSLINNEDDNYYPVLLGYDTVEILSTEGYPFMIFNFDSRGDRVFGYIQNEVGAHFMSYYDQDIGFVPTSIPSAYTSVVTYNEMTDMTVVVAADRFTNQAGIYRVSDTSITEVNVPAGPHEDIKLLYRNDDTQTSLFSLKDTAGVVRLAKRVGGNWTDLTSQLFAGEIKEISVLKNSETDAFLNVNSLSVGNLLFNFQSYPTGDALYNLTPFGDSYSFIKVMYDEVEHYLSLSFQGTLGDHLYTYEYGLEALVSPGTTFDNPNGIISEDFVHSGNQLYQFSYPGNTPWGFVEHLYHRTHPKDPLFPVSVNDTTVINQSCALSDKIIYKEIDTLDNQRIMIYDTLFQLTREVNIPKQDTSRILDIIDTDRMCLLQEFKNNSRDSTTRVFITTDESVDIIDVTDQNYNIKSFVELWDFNGFLLSPLENRQNESDDKLWLMTSYARKIDDCQNIDYKYFREPRTPIFDSELMADKIHISSLFGETLLPDQVFEFTGLEEINLDQGAEIEEGIEVNFLIDVDRCNN